MKRYFILISFLFFIHACVPLAAQDTPVGPSMPAPPFTSSPNLASPPIEMTPTSPPTLSPTPTPRPSDTPDPTPSTTVTAAPTVLKTVEPRPTTELIDIPLPGKIYVWAVPFYGYLAPNQRYQEDITPLGGQYPREQTPETAILVAFSSYTHQIAYLLETPEQKLDLWLADLALQAPRSVWVDRENLLGYSQDDIWIWMRWGPADQFILLENISLSGPNEGSYFWAIYSFGNSAVTTLSGPCDQLFVSPQSDEFAIGCPINETNFVVLEQDGTHWNIDGLPDNTILAKDWVISPDGKRVLYANEQDEISVASHDLGTLKLSMSYPGRSNDRILQWSQDGSKLLIYGNDAERCPFSAFIGRTPPCWQVVDSVTGEVIWASSLVSGYDATLSPDGQWVVMFHMDPSVFPIMRWGAIYALADNSATIFYNWLVDAVVWGD